MPGKLWEWLVISTHTPARGVTNMIHTNCINDIISTHTPARGVTILESLPLHCLADFNPHSRKGSDVLRDPGFGYVSISTHTPARGVTADRFQVYPQQQISTHTPARGVTKIMLQLFYLQMISTHTPARGVTVKQTIFHLNIFLFFYTIY